MAAEPTETVAVSTFPLPPHDYSSGGMCVSLRGTLGRAATECRRSASSRYLASALDQLNDHIEQLRSAKDDADALLMLANFFRLYVKE